ncbi:hypothetical protein ACP26L_22595 [Paenibacillus sp. S-38]|uniref:hypothetical protein n=1 Tax=Paenibacillus sp. S-38 TaxID=3416710 RepID=UPI003CF3F317
MSIVSAALCQFFAWVILVLSLQAYSPLGWFLPPNVNNTPAFITVSKWLVQCLLVTNLFSFALTQSAGYHLRRRGRPSLRWDGQLHFTMAAVHLFIVNMLIILVAGFEDL